MVMITMTIKPWLLVPFAFYQGNALNTSLYLSLKKTCLKKINYNIYIYLQCTQIMMFINRFLERFDDEVQQIELKQSISKNRANQHHSRLNAIKMTVDKETAEYNGGGIGKFK